MLTKFYIWSSFTYPHTRTFFQNNSFKIKSLNISLQSLQDISTISFHAHFSSTNLYFHKSFFSKYLPIYKHFLKKVKKYLIIYFFLYNTQAKKAKTTSRVSSVGRVPSSGKILISQVKRYKMFTKSSSNFKKIVWM